MSGYYRAVQKMRWGAVVVAGVVVLTLAWALTYQTSAHGPAARADAAHSTSAPTPTGTSPDADRSAARIAAAPAAIRPAKVKAAATHVRMAKLALKAHQVAVSKTAARKAAARKAADTPFSFKIGTFNLLGSQHTAPGGDEASVAPGYVRTKWAADVINSEGADVVGFDEMQRDQYAVMMSHSPGFASYPGTSLGNPGIPTNIIWRTSRFQLVSSSTLTITFLGQKRPMPIVELRDIATGREFYVFNAHNSPVQTKHNYQAERNVQMSAEIAKINALRKTGLPVFFLGDMNEHSEIFCKVRAGTDLVSPAGGNNTGGCHAPGNMRVDWLFGSATWSGYQLNRDALVRRATDHTVLFATATVN